MDLMSKGYHVFRALSPSCPCDLLILKDGELLKIEVKTAYIINPQTDKIYWSMGINNTPQNVDIFALVLPDKIIYQPELLQ